MMRFWVKMLDRILVIKLAALGDFIQALGPFMAIRRHHKAAHITLLTTEPFFELSQVIGLFDKVLVDKKPRFYSIPKWLHLRGQLRSESFDRVYDLQTSDRSSFYRFLFWPGQNPEWSGVAWGSSHPHDNPNRDSMHTIERQIDQLRLLGIRDFDGSDCLSKLTATTDQFNLPTKFSLIVPGGATHRPEKRWPVNNFIELARAFVADGIIPILLGGPAENNIVENILSGCPGARSLICKTSLLQLAALARMAIVSVGNDTGPMHLIAAVGCPSVVLFSHASDPMLCGQRGPNVTFIRKPNLHEVTVEEVKRAINA